MSAAFKRKQPSSGRWKGRGKRGLAILPSLLTLGNAICGISAIIKVAKIQWAAEATSPYFWGTNLRDAALLILFGMVFDLFDGRVARMTRTTSDFGGQLDSLSDAITFGVAPGVLTIMANAEARFPGQPFWTKLAWVFGIAYSCGAVARLARFNVENDHDEKAHMEFKGLPSPAAAGVIATLTLLQSWLLGFGTHVAAVTNDALLDFAKAITFVLPFVALGLGYLMVSKFRYVHVANRYFRGRKPFYYLRVLFIPAVLAALVPEVAGALIFFTFALTGPILALRTRGRPQVATVPETTPASLPPPAQPLPAAEAPALPKPATGT